MNAVFSESITTLNDFDVIVIVSQESMGDFITNKIKEITKNSFCCEDFQDLGYKKIKSFNVLTNEKNVNIIIAGAGKKDKLNRASLEKLGGYIFDHIKSKNSKVCIFNNVESSGLESASSYLTSGIILKSWEFDKYKSEKNDRKIDSITCQTNYSELNKECFKSLDKLIESVNSVRNMVTEPSNFMTPDQIVEECMSLKKLGVKVTVLDKKNMEKLGMNALLGVGKGSNNPSYLIAMEYKSDKSKDLVAFAGKGVTFDSGGISLKPSKGMGDMKGDMAGAAVVIGTMKAIASNELKTNVVGLVGVVENMISSKAQKPGDVVVSMSKKTIEVDNTDAEGRLVLADVLWYAKEEYSPKVIIDIATLTGAIQVALGHEFAGLFSNSDELSNALEKAGNTVGEKLWRLPVHPSYESDIKSDIADIKNIGCGRGAGSITAAMFLQNFVDNNTKWAHIDIAATEWDTKNRALSQKGATGFGVRLLSEFINTYHSSK